MQDHDSSPSSAVAPPSNPPARSVLPVEHPEFRYPESKHPYLDRAPRLRDYTEFNQGTEGLRGEWRTRFPDASSHPADRKLHVEIGCNGGHVTLGWAARNPGTAYIGVDWKIKQIVLAGEKTHRRGIKNALFLRAHAARVGHMFAENEVDFIALYCPDPWPKKAHRKNRIFTAAWLESVRRVLKPGGVFHVKTDHREYFDRMLEVAEAARGWEWKSKTFDLHAGNPDASKLQIPDATLFERIFIRDGLPIHAMELAKR